MNSFIKWIGGKKLLRKQIIDSFPVDYDKYVEVFGGAGWVLFGKEPSKEEIYNDMNGDLVNLFRIVKYHPEELQKELNFTLNSREIFINARSQMETEGLTDIQRAARFYILIRYSYGANLRNYTGRKIDHQNGIDYLKYVSERLNKVTIEHYDFEKIINLYDGESALFYLDPPYHGTEKYYTATFGEEDHVRLFESLQNIKGRFILSYNQDTYIEELYKKYNIRYVSRSNSLLTRYEVPDDKRNYKELIITNY